MTVEHLVLPHKQEPQINRQEYPVEYFQAQVEFAKKWSRITGVEVADALMGVTTLRHDFRLMVQAGWPEPWTNIGLKQGGSVVAKRIHEFRVLIKDPHLSANPNIALAENPFSPFTYDHIESSSENEWTEKIRIHFAGSMRGQHTELSDLHLLGRQQAIKRMFQHIQFAHPEAEEVIGGSWLYNLPAYRASFPPEYTLEMKRLIPELFDLNIPNATPGLNLDDDSVWGQFVNRFGWVRQQTYETFMKNLKTATSITDLLDAFPYKTLQPKAPIGVFYNWSPAETPIKVGN